MIGSILRRAPALGAVLLASLAVFGASSASAAQVVVYRNIPAAANLPGNTVSQGFECCQTSEFGGAVHFPNNTARRNPYFRIGLSSWACVEGEAEGNNCVTPKGSTFSLPVTLNVYAMNPDKSVGAKAFSTTETFQIPYRPSASGKCTTGEAKGGWWGPTGTGSKACLHGKLNFIKFKTTGLLPESNAIISVTYNTRDYGYAPTGVPGPSDALNVALTDPNAPFGPPSVGEYANPKEDYAYSFYENEDPMCGGQLGVFGPTGPCDEHYQPLIEVKAS